jgi:DNA-binding Xre family transcriptional regulator
MHSTANDTGRFWVKLISARVLADYMQHRDETVRSLATKVGCSASTIGHLRSGKRNTCKPAVAKAIEKHLNAPPGSLFVPQVSRVASDAGRAA